MSEKCIYIGRHSEEHNAPWIYSKKCFCTCSDSLNKNRNDETAAPHKTSAILLWCYLELHFYWLIPFKLCFVILSIKMKTYLLVGPNKVIEVTLASKLCWQRSTAFTQHWSSSVVSTHFKASSSKGVDKLSVHCGFPLIPVNIPDLFHRHCIWLTVKLYSTLHSVSFQQNVVQKVRVERGETTRGIIRNEKDQKIGSCQ